MECFLQFGRIMIVIANVNIVLSPKCWLRYYVCDYCIFL